MDQGKSPLSTRVVNFTIIDRGGPFLKVGMDFVISTGESDSG